MSRRSASLGIRLLACLILVLLARATESRATLTTATPGGTAASATRPFDVSTAQFPVVTIAGSRYLYGNLTRIGASLVRTPSIRLALRIINACPRAKAYGFISTRGSGAGVVAWMPTNPLECFGTTGGGPSIDPCLQSFRTRTSPRYYALIAATGRQTCADLSTQAPGGVSARTTRGVPGLPAQSNIVVKCQIWRSQGLMDYVAPYRNSLPASKPAFWIHDYYVATGVDERLAGVPTCWGVNFTF